jgi:hypothetical protein
VVSVRVACATFVSVQVRNETIIRTSLQEDDRRSLIERLRSKSVKFRFMTWSVVPGFALSLALVGCSPEENAPAENPAPAPAASTPAPAPAPTEAKPADKKDEAKPADDKKDEAKPADKKDEAKPADDKKDEAKPAEKKD